MDRNHLIAHIAKEIKRKTWNGTNLGPTRTMRYNLGKDLCLTFNAPTNPITHLNYSLRHWDFGHMTFNIVISERLGSEHRRFVRRVRLKFWQKSHEWDSRKIVEEHSLTGEEKDWASGDNDAPIEPVNRSKVLSNRTYPTVTDYELRKIQLALEELMAEGTWPETFWEEEKHWEER